MDIPPPLRLAVGSHAAGSGKGCAMNVVSYENGDTQITDLPDCSDVVLARVVQVVNDRICTHREGDLLCAPCSITVLALAHRTVGSAGVLPAAELRVVWVKVACALARSVAHHNTDPRVMTAIVAAETCLDDPSAAVSSAAVSSAAAASDAAASYASYAAAVSAADAAVSSAASAASAAASAAYAASYAVSAADAAYAASASYASAASAVSSAAVSAAAASAAASAERRDALLRIGNLAVDTFNTLTGRLETPTSLDHVERAVAEMMAVTS